MDRLTQFSGSSKAAVRDELMPLLSAMVKDAPQIGDSNEFGLSIRLGFSGEEHASMAGLPPSRRSTKDLIKAYNIELETFLSEQEQVAFEVIEEPVEAEGTAPDKDKDDAPPGQMKLF